MGIVISVPYESAAMRPLSFWNKRRKNARDDASPSQADRQTAALFSTAGNYGIQTLAEPENASIE
jgi:hypothetical protein